MARIANTKIEYFERINRIMAARRQGTSIADIAAAEGLGPNTVRRLLRRALESYVIEETAEVYKLEVARLDRMLEILWPQLEQGSQRAADRILKLMDRRASLMGLDAKKTATSDATELDGPVREIIVEVPEGTNMNQHLIADLEEELISESPA